MSTGAIRQRHVLGTAEAAKGYSLVRSASHPCTTPPSTQASHWETAAALTAAQTRALDTLADKLTQQSTIAQVRCLRDRLFHTRTQQPVLVTAPTPGAQPPPGDDGDDLVLEDALLHNTNQFYKWISELEAARTSESEHKYETYASILRGHLEASTLVEDRVCGCVLWLCNVCPCALLHGCHQELVM